MNSRYRTDDDAVVVAYASGQKEDRRHYWLKWKGTDDIATLPVTEVKRRVATGQWKPLD